MHRRPPPTHDIQPADLLRQTQAPAFNDWLIHWRRDLHQHPELSGHEQRTAQVLTAELEKLGYTVRPHVHGHGFLADLSAPQGHGWIALRADMDALPIAEQNPVDYASRTPGVAHLCGHDAHMTIALGAARLLAFHRAKLPKSVRLIFQPHEEVLPGGAKGMIAAGALDGVDKVFGLHNLPTLDVGQIATRPGTLSAGTDIFTVNYKGRGGHAAKPHEALDPIPAACALVMQAQTLISRRRHVLRPAVLSITQFTAGNTHNVIPDAATLKGTVRTFDAQTHDLVQHELARMAFAVAEIHGLQATFDYVRGYDSIVNHESAVADVCTVATRLVGEANVNANCDPESWGEDFAYYLQHCQGAFFLLGSGNRAQGICEPLHSPRMNIDERCLAYGAAMMAALALEG